MRLLLPAASAALIAAVALSATATATDTAPVPVNGAAVPAASTRRSSAGSAMPGSALASSALVTVITATGAKTAAPDTTRVASSRGFGWPLSPRPAVLRRFEPPRNQWSPGHRGVDLRAAVGQPVLSAGAGVVAFSGVVAGRGVITVRHSSGLRTTYEPVDQRLASGIVVHRDAKIGVLSPTPGHCVPLTCLHWGVISGQTYLDPLALLGFSQPILLPLG